jgi:hypothetical protein
MSRRSSGGGAPFTFEGDESGRAISGGYAFSRHCALQATHYDSGEHFATDCPAPICTAVPNTHFADVTGLAVAAVGTWRLAPALEIFGKVGVLGWDTDFDLESAGVGMTYRF